MRFILAFALILAASAAHAETRVVDGTRSLPRVNDTVEAAGLVQIRESSPDPTFGKKGDPKGWLKAGETMRVLTVKNYISVYGSEIWLEVQREGEEKAAGWIFAGLAKEMAKGKSVVSVHMSPEAKARAEEEARAAKAQADAMARSDALVRDEDY